MLFDLYRAQSGGEIDRTALSERAASAGLDAIVWVDNVLTTDELTFFPRFGYLAGNGAAFAAFLLILASLKFSRRSASLDPSEAQV